MNARELSEAMKTARVTGLPVGRVLIMAGHVSEQEFQSAVQAQSLVRDGIVPLETAVAALAHLADSEVTFDDALSKVGWKQTEDKESNKLGELFTTADIVPNESLQAAMPNQPGHRIAPGQAASVLEHNLGRAACHRP